MLSRYKQALLAACGDARHHQRLLLCDAYLPGDWAGYRYCVQCFREEDRKHITNARTRLIATHLCAPGEQCRYHQTIILSVLKNRTLTPAVRNWLDDIIPVQPMPMPHLSAIYGPTLENRAE